MFLDLLREEPGDAGGDREGREREEWRIYFAFRGELPSNEELAQLRGLVITGSM